MSWVGFEPRLVDYKSELALTDFKFKHQRSTNVVLVSKGSL